MVVLDFDLSEQIDVEMKRIAAFSDSESFRAMFSELMSFPTDARRDIVEVVLLNKERLKKLYDIDVPEGIKIQRSEFADKRPTLFCITSYLPKGRSWHKVTVTFDNPEGSAFEPINRQEAESVSVS